ncbi:MAG: VOC family protein [Bacteroidota bacterium]
MKRVTGIGGIFFKTKDPEKTRSWYSTHLGLSTDEYGATFEWRQAGNPERKGYTQWSVMPEDSDYFQPSGKDFMINYRVENMASLVELLKSEGVTVLDEIAEFEYGKFVHILDPDGVKIELWEPVDNE